MATIESDESEITKVTTSISIDSERERLSIACNQIADGNSEEALLDLMIMLQKPGNLSLLLKQDDRRLEGIRKEKLKRFYDREKRTIESAEYLAQNPDYLELI